MGTVTTKRIGELEVGGAYEGRTAKATIINGKSKYSDPVCIQLSLWGDNGWNTYYSIPITEKHVLADKYLWHAEVEVREFLLFLAGTPRANDHHHYERIL